MELVFRSHAIEFTAVSVPSRKLSIPKQFVLKKNA